MKPQDFLLGARDFFAVLIPGAVLLLILRIPWDQLKPEGLGLFAYAVAAYLLGSLASVAGGLADYLIDPVLRSGLYRKSRFGKKLDRRERAAGVLRDSLVEALPARDAVLQSYSAKSFWWDRLRLDCPPALQELDRIEARQKLFRSLMAIFLFLLLFWNCLPRSSMLEEVYETPKVALVLASLTLMSAFLYAFGRAQFESALYRLAAGYYANLPASSGSGRATAGQATPAQG